MLVIYCDLPTYMYLILVAYMYIYTHYVPYYVDALCCTCVIYVIHVILYISYRLYAVQVICMPTQRDVCRNIRTLYTYAHQTNPIFPEDSVGISTYIYIYIYIHTQKTCHSY